MVKWTEEMREKIKRPATLNDVYQTNAIHKIIWIDGKPYVLKDPVSKEQNRVR